MFFHNINDLFYIINPQLREEWKTAPQAQAVRHELLLRNENIRKIRLKRTCAVPQWPGFRDAATKAAFIETHLKIIYVEALLKTNCVRASHKNIPNISKYVRENFATTDPRLAPESIRKLLSRSWQTSGLSDYAKAGISVLDTSVIAQLNTFITKGDHGRQW